MLTRHLFTLLCVYQCFGHKFKQYLQFDFNKQYGVCVNTTTWTQGYHFLDHEITSSILTPNEKLSCVATGVMPIPSGVLEAKVFVQLASQEDRVSVLVYKSLNGKDKFAGRADIIASEQNGFNGSHTLTIRVTKSDGYVSIITFIYIYLKLKIICYHNEKL